MIPLWLLYAGGGLASYALYEKLVKKEPHPFTGSATPVAVVRKKAVAFINASANALQLRTLSQGLSKAGHTDVAAAAATKAAVLERRQAEPPKPTAAAPIVAIPPRVIDVPGAGAVAIPGFTVSAPSSPLPKPSPTPAPSPVSLPSVAVNLTVPPTVQQGSSGVAVGQWQAIIGVPIDGKFGPQTKAATVAWQKAHGLAADGIVGPKTWTAALS
jgi:hypothetical protein